MPYYKILAGNGRSHGFDLSNESTAAGTTVTVWQYNDSNPTPIHRQWMLFPLTASTQPDAIEEITTNLTPAFNSSAASVYDLSGRRFANSRQLPKGIYIIQGRKMVVR